jgi:hypothetical protein
MFRISTQGRVGERSAAGQERGQAHLPDPELIGVDSDSRRKGFQR